MSEDLDKRPQRTFSPLCRMRAQREDGHLGARKWALPRYRTCWHLDLGLLVSRTVRSKLFVSHPMYGIFVISA